MKITTIFLNKKNIKRKFDINQKLNISKKIDISKKYNIIDDFSNKDNFNFGISKIVYGFFLVMLVLIFCSLVLPSNKVIYFASNFRQAESKKFEISSLFNIYGIYNKENYIFAKEEKVEKAKENTNLENGDYIKVIDEMAESKKEQSVFGKSQSLNEEITENSANIQRITLNKMKILNYSSKRDIDFKSFDLSNIVLTKKSDKILLYNTHTSESYANSDKYKFDYSGQRRSKDANFNMLSVANRLKENLTAKGIEVVHDTTPHDYGTYTSSYSRSRITAKNALSTMGSAGIIIDVHRDATADLDYRPVANINGVQVAQCMFVIGVGNDVTANPYYEDNLRLAVKMQQIADEVYPGLFKPMIIRNSIYNQDLNKYSLLIEVGASGNTLDEAYLSTRCLANLLNIVYKD